MNINDLQTINQLYGERTSLQGALELVQQSNLSIVGLLLSQAPNMPPIQIPTGFMTYPSQMIDAIKTQMQARLDAIDQELGKFGFAVANRSAKK